MSLVYPWQEALWQSVMQRYQQGRLPHALLLHGHQGVGKLHFATSLAKFLLCSQPSDNQPCGNCHSCHLFEAGNHPDLTLVAPEQPGKDITIAMIRQLSSQLTMSSQYEGYKVVIINPAEQMNVASANSLLKTLEEPTDNTLLILVCSQLDRLLPTVKSRCQKILMEAGEPESSRQWLLQALNEKSHGEVDALLKLANNAPLLALEMANTEILPQRAELIKVLGELARGGVTPVAAANNMSGIALGQVIEWLTRWTMDMIRLKFSQAPVHMETPDTLDSLRNYAKQIDLVRLYGYFDHLLESARLSKTQVNEQLLLEDSFTGWMRLFSSRS